MRVGGPNNDHDAGNRRLLSPVAMSDRKRAVCGNCTVFRSGSNDNRCTRKLASDDLRNVEAHELVVWGGLVAGVNSSGHLLDLFLFDPAPQSRL